MSLGWNAVLDSSNGEGGDKVEFVKLPVGITKLRLLDEQPKAIWKHWIQAANDGKGMSVTCSGKDTCIVCKVNREMEAQGLKKKYTVSRAFAMNSLVTENGEEKVQILEKGAGLFSSFYTLKTQMGDLINYEVNITRTGTKMNDTKYMALPVMPFVALTDTRKEEILAKRIDLEEFYKPLTREAIEILMNGGGLEQNTEDENPQFEVEA